MTCPICNMLAAPPAENRRWIFCLAFAGGIKGDIPVDLCEDCKQELSKAMKEIAGVDYAAETTGKKEHLS